MLLDKNLVKAVEDDHVDWFVKLAAKKCSWAKKTTREKYLSKILNFSPSKSFKDSIRPYLVGDRAKMCSLKRKLKTKTGKQATKLLEAFGYKEFTEKRKKRWGAFKFCEKIKVNVCPYCNRQYTFTVKNIGNDYVARPEIDHFFPKNIYPYLSCNLYNFIPSCHTCNNIKSSKVRNILYPYEDDFDALGDFKLSYNNNDLTGKKIGTFDVVANRGNIIVKLVSNDKKFKNAASLFHLEDLYNMHEIELYDFLERYKNYQDPKLKEIKSLLKNKHLDQNKLKKYILGFPILDDDKNYPLKKFKKDIKKQLDNS